MTLNLISKSKQWNGLMFSGGLFIFLLLFTQIHHILSVRNKEKSLHPAEDEEHITGTNNNNNINNKLLTVASNSDLKQNDYRWLNKQLNVLIDEQTLNSTERQILDALFDQIEHKTCIKVNRISPNNVNPFDSHRYLSGAERNFVYIFKTSQLPIHSKQPAVIGLSTFGCVRQGRQSMILSDLAFSMPELVLAYHVLRTLGVRDLKRPDKQVRKLLDQLPLNQKISIASSNNNNKNSALDVSLSEGPYFAYATIASALAARTSASAPDPMLATNGQDLLATTSSSSGLMQKPVKSVEYLTEGDLSKIKELYECPSYVNTLSLKPLDSLTTPIDSPTTQAAEKQVKNNESAELSSHFYSLSLLQPQQQLTVPPPPTTLPASESRIEDAAKSIANSLLAEEASATCKQLTSDGKACIANNPTATNKSERGGKVVEDADVDSDAMRPMLLKLDPFNARDPLMQQANQMKLSLINGNESYQLMNSPDWTPKRTEQQLRLPEEADLKDKTNYSDKKSTPKTSTEMQISFEQTTGSALAQVLKLCSCTCQTMIPSPVPKPQPQPTVDPNCKPETSETSATQTMTTTTPPPPTVTQFPLTEPTWIIKTESTTSWTSEATETVRTTKPTTSSSNTEPETTTSVPVTTTTSEPETEEQPIVTFEPTTSQTSSKSTKTEQPTATESTQEMTSKTPATTMTTTTTTTTTATTTSSYCDQVEWVKPNKTVYSSAKIVWDVDRANQNYFLCQNQVNGELVPGKTHGFSCKVSNEGKAYELHNFKVLTKPERVNLAWVQRDSNSFGKTNLPVMGGYSKKTEDPYVVSRCLVRDENNDVITLIGYVNSQGIGWFPFDDIQIECAQYDVLACVASS